MNGIVMGMQLLCTWRPDTWRGVTHTHRIQDTMWLRLITSR